MKCGINDSAVYRFTNNMIRPYPGLDVSTSWDPNILDNILLIDCQGMEVGSEMTFNPDAFISIRNNKNSQMCLHVDDSEPYSIDVKECSNDPGQRWLLDYNGFLRSNLDYNLCVSAARSNPGIYSKLYLSPCDAEEYNKWFYPDSYLRGKNSDWLIGVSHGCGGVNIGQLVELQGLISACSQQQKWTFDDTR